MSAYTIQVSNQIGDIVKALEEESHHFKLILIRKTEMRTKLLERGISLGYDYWILEFSEPDLSKKILLKDPLAGLYLPGKIAIYPHDNSKLTTISLFLPTQTLKAEVSAVAIWIRQWEKKLINLIKRVQSR